MNDTDEAHPVNITMDSSEKWERAQSPLHQLESDRFREGIIRAIEGLPEREQLVLSLYYEEELNLREIGSLLGVSESRVCQIHGQALIRLRARLQDWTESDR